MPLPAHVISVSARVFFVVFNPKIVRNADADIEKPVFISRA